MDLKEIRDQINQLGTQMSELLHKAKTENREQTADEAEQFDKIDTDREKLLATERRMAKVAEFEASAGRRSDPLPPTDTRRSGARSPERTAATPQDHTETLRAWFTPDRRTPEQLESARRCGINLDAKSLHIGLAARPPASTREADLQEWEKRYLGVDIISPDNGGHYLVPNELMRGLEVAMLSFGGMRTVATVLRTDTGANLPIPTMNDTANEGVEIGEGVEETTELEPTIGQLVLEAYTYSSKKIPVSMEFMQDNAINFAGRVGEILGERIARITNRRFTVGTGSGQPKGIVTAATASGITTATATVVSYDEIVGLVHSVDPAYRAQRTGPQAARFMFHDNTLLALKKIKVPQFSGDTAGYPLWKAGMAASDPDTIDGYGYVINQHMPLPTASQKAVLFGALHKYQIRDVRLVEVVRLNELRAEFRQVVWMAWSRHDGDLLDAGTHPVKYLAMHS